MSTVTLRTTQCTSFFLARIVINTFPSEPHGCMSSLTGDAKELDRRGNARGCLSAIGVSLRIAIGHAGATMMYCDSRRLGYAEATHRTTLIRIPSLAFVSRRLAHLGTSPSVPSLHKSPSPSPLPPSSPVTMALSALAAKISKHAAILDEYIASNDLPAPSFSADGPLDFPIPSTASPELRASRTALLEATNSLFDLTTGPTTAISWAGFHYQHELVALRALNNFNIPEAVPLGKGASFASIAASTGLSEDFVTRIIRFSATSNIFVESPPGNVQHTAGSRALLENPLLRDFLRTCIDDSLPAATKVNEAVAKYGGILEDKKKTAFSEAYGEGTGYMEFLEKPGEEGRKKALVGTWRYMMAGTLMQGKSHDPAMVVTSGACDWEGVKTVVDIGCGTAACSAAIASAYPGVKCIAQDLVAPPKCPDNVKYEGHDFFTPQPVKDADVYLLRNVLREWSDPYAVQILQQVVPAMGAGSKVLIVDHVLSEPGSVEKVMEKVERAVDLSVMQMLAGKERSRGDWEKLVKEADERLEVTKVTCPRESALGFVEVKLVG
ncbi:O-methyltransferase-domain-containing protein [Trichophaea hybrida]|nr:O-methyltransferase-domain-containing protein [Trichophaea hybrida]